MALSLHDCVSISADIINLRDDMIRAHILNNVNNTRQLSVVILEMYICGPMDTMIHEIDGKIFLG